MNLIWVMPAEGSVFMLSVRSLGIVLSASALLLATGCAKAPPDAAVSGSTPASGGPTTVRLLAHDSFVVSEALVADFERQTGLDLEILTGGDAGTMVAGAILAAGAPTADVMYGVDNTLLSRALDANIFEPYSAAETDTIAPELLSGAGDGVVTPIDYGDVCVNVDDGALAARDLTAPRTLDDLVRPEYRDLLVVEDPGTSSPGLAFLLATIARYGDDWQGYWQALADNGVQVASSWTDAYMGEFTGGGGGGSRPLVVSYATSPPAEIVYAADPKPTQPSTSVMTDGCYRQVEYAGVLAGAANPAGARAVVDWLASEPVQSDVPLSMFVFPARQGITLPDVFVDFAADVPNPLQLEPSDVAEKLPGWLAEWGTVMGR
jgi:thiamine transport system substrate-binding protein